MEKFKKIAVFTVCTILLASLQAFAECPLKENNCPQAFEMNKDSCFLCTNSDIEEVFKGIGLSDSQICSARKLQEKYEQETLSVNDRLMYEEGVFNELNCSCTNNSEIREQKKKIKNLKKLRNKICRCYEEQFKTMLSDTQRRKYKKYGR